VCRVALCKHSSHNKRPVTSKKLEAVIRGTLRVVVASIATVALIALIAQIEEVSENPSCANPLVVCR
jgi:hypothetical protein